MQVICFSLNGFQRLCLRVFYLSCLKLFTVYPTLSMSVGSVLSSPLSFWILVVYVFSFFLYHSALSILLIFMKNLILVFSFHFVSLVPVSLIFALSFSFCLLWISFVFSYKFFKIEP